MWVLVSATAQTSPALQLFRTRSLTTPHLPAAPSSSLTPTPLPFPFRSTPPQPTHSTMGPTKPSVPVAGVPVAGAATTSKVTAGAVKDVPVVATNAIPVVPAVPVKATAATPVVAVPVSTKAATLEQVVEVPKTVGVPKPVEILNETARPVDKVVEVEKIVRWRLRGGVAASDRDEYVREGSYSPCHCPGRYCTVALMTPCTHPVMPFLSVFGFFRNAPSSHGELHRWRRRSLWKWRRSNMWSARWRSSRRSQWSRRYVGLQ